MTFTKTNIVCGFGGLGLAYWPLVPNFAGSNPAEAVGFLRAEKAVGPMSRDLCREIYVARFAAFKDP
jgi:hypothetical protein